MNVVDRTIPIADSAIYVVLKDCWGDTRQTICRIGIRMTSRREMYFRTKP